MIELAPGIGYTVVREKPEGRLFIMHVDGHDEHFYDRADMDDEDILQQALDFRAGMIELDYDEPDADFLAFIDYLSRD